MIESNKKKTKISKVINASDIGQFHFCSISWYLKKLGYKPQSDLIDQGTSKHKKLGNTIDNTKKYSKKSKLFKLIGLLFLILSSIVLIIEVIL